MPRLITIDDRQCDGVVNQHDSTRSQNGHAGQTRQTRHLGTQVLDDDLLVSQNFINVDRYTLTSATEDGNRVVAGNRLHALGRCLQKRTRPEEWHLFAIMRESRCLVGLFKILRRNTLHDLDNIGGYPNTDGAQPQHDNLGHRRRQRQYQPKGGAEPWFGGRFNSSAKRIHLRADNVHADTTTSQLGDFSGRRQTGHEDQIRSLGIAQDRARWHQTVADRLCANTLQIQAAPIVRELDRHIVTLMVQRNGDCPNGRLACRRSC